MNKTLGPIRRRNGIAGQYAYDVTVTYHVDMPNGSIVDSPSRVSFVGSVYGAPVVVCIYDEKGAELWQVVVNDWTQFGPNLSPEWIRRFYADRGQS